MSTFRLYLWKEWREHRAALVALGVMLPLVVLATGASLSKKQISSGWFVGVSAGLALVMQLVVVGGEVFASERRCGQWLERLPRGLATAFPAKAVFFLAACVTALFYGFGWSSLDVVLRGGDVFGRSWATSRAEELAISAGLAFALAIWTFAAAPWSPRGMLAVFAGLLLGGGLGYPLFAHAFAGYRPSAVEMVVFGALFLIGAPLGAWAGFVRGWRFGRGSLAAFWRGGVLGVAALAPIWPYALWRLRERDTFDLASPHFHVRESVWVSAEGNVAVARGFMDFPWWFGSQPEHTLWLDLERRVAVDLGEEPRYFAPIVRTGSTIELGLRLLSYSESRDYSDERGELLRSSDPDRLGFAGKAGRGWKFRDGHRQVTYLDPESGLRLSAEELGLDSYTDVEIGPLRWLIRDDWRVLDPTSRNIVAAEWLEDLDSCLSMLPDGRVLGRMGGQRLALIDLVAETIEPVHLNGARFARLGELCVPLLFRDYPRTYRLDLERRELVPLDESWSGTPLRTLADGDVMLLTEDGFARRDSTTGERAEVIRWSEFELTEEVTP